MVAAVEVEAVDRAMRDGVHRLVGALALEDVRQGDVKRDRNGAELPEIGIILDHPALDRVLEQEDVPDLLQFADDRTGIAGILPALIGIEDHLHAGRVLPDFRAPGHDVVLEVAFELDAVETLLMVLPDPGADFLDGPVTRPGADLHMIADRAPEEAVQRNAEGFRIGIPDRAFEPVIFPRQSNGQVLQGHFGNALAEKHVRDALNDAPVVVPVEFRDSDRPVLQGHPQDELRQLIELNRPGPLAADRKHVKRLVEAVGIDDARMGGNDHLFVVEADDGLGVGIHGAPAEREGQEMRREED